MKQYRTVQFDRIDRICEKRYGSTENRIVEFILDVNDGLEQYGIILPAGILIELPDLPAAPPRQEVVQIIHLW
ncbi:MAG: tail protein X [Rhizobiaceae bacterium]|nr:tail protein X [Rhizobiaceae bacterium]MCC0000983.1 tail protein X [Methylobacteriaceae bacterium]